jgi:hypothetical protein
VSAAKRVRCSWAGFPGKRVSGCSCRYTAHETISGENVISAQSADSDRTLAPSSLFLRSAFGAGFPWSETLSRTRGSHHELPIASVKIAFLPIVGLMDVVSLHEEWSVTRGWRTTPSIPSSSRIP